MKCKLHPNYKGIIPPTSNKEGCTCNYIYEANRLCVPKNLSKKSQKFLDSFKRLSG